MNTVTETRPTQPKAGPIAILLVDDDADCRLFMREAIAECKIAGTVHETRDGEEALDFLYRRGRHAAAPRPGLVYLDIEMPGISGLEVLAKIKSDPSLRDIPVVMMTGVCDEAQMKQAARSGANSYTLKPASAEQFIQTLHESTNYWMCVHQYPDRHLDPEECRR